MTRITFEDQLRALKAENVEQARELGELARGSRAAHLRNLFASVSAYEAASQRFAKAKMAEHDAFNAAMLEYEQSAVRVRMAATAWVRSVRTERSANVARRNRVRVVRARGPNEERRRAS